MKKYFQLLVEGKVDNTPKLLAPDIMPTGKFFIHPDTNMVMLTPEGMETSEGYHHDNIAAKYGLKDTAYALSQRWVRGKYKEQHLHLEGYHGHEVLRGVLSRFSSLLPHGTQFKIDNYDREDGKMDSREFTGTEALNQYIQGGGINPIVAPTSTSTPTDYAVEKELRKTVPESQRPFESFTFSKLRTQLNEEHDDLIKEIDPVMWIHKDSIYGGGYEDGHDHNYLAQQILGDYDKRPEGNYSDQVLGLGGWTRLMKVGTQFEIESASHDALRDTLRRIEPHIAGQKVHLEVRDPNNTDPAHVWSRSTVDAEQLRHYIKYGHQARSLRVESWQEYDAKVGETNTSLFEPGNSKFNMKAFLKKLRKKNRVGVNLPGEN